MAWYEHAERKQGNSGGTFTSGPFKGVLHTTEGKTAAGAFAAYTKNNSWPHFTVSYERGYFQCWQHVDTAVAARALRNESGGVQTNRDSAIQIEIVGTCDVRNRDSWGEQYVENFPQAYLDGIAALMRWIESVTGVQRVWFAPALKEYPASYGKGNGVRLSQTAWDNGSGWCGHQNVPENTHGDPGLININYLIGANVTLPSPTPNPRPDDGMLRVGSRGQRVVDLQNLLNFWGWGKLTVDGIFGAATKEAVRTAQKALGVAVDGVWGPGSQKAYGAFVAFLQSLQNNAKNNGTGWMKANHPILRRGAKGGRVQHLQSFLGVRQDGDFGPLTEDAVRRKQKSFGLSVDGIVGPKTWAVLHSAARRGDSHGSVAEIQRELGITADGQFGPKTEEEVKKYQRAKGLKVDGIVGTNTYRKMFS